MKKQDFVPGILWSTEEAPNKPSGAMQIRRMTIYSISAESKTTTLSKCATMVTLLTLIFVLSLGCPSSIEAQPSVVLWNKLGTTTEIQNSEIGANGQTNAPLTFAPVQHGDGVALGSGTAQVKFVSPFGTSFPDAGTIEFWWVPGRDENSSTGSHFDERFPLLLTSDATRANNFPETEIFLAYSGNFQNHTRIFFGIDSDRVILEYDLNYKAGDIIHVAITWNKSLGNSPVKTFFDGIEGVVVADFSTNPGQVVQNIQDKIQDATYTYDIELLRRSKRPDGAQNQFDAGQFIDNIKVFDIAKTDFSDRFIEGFDTDGDGIPDDVDVCPDENPMSLDADQDGCIDSAVGLIDSIEILPSDALDDTLKNSLIEKVTNADQQANKDNLCAAINVLEAFQNAVEAQRDKKITGETADLLIDYATNLITQFQEALSEMGESCDP